MIIHKDSKGIKLNGYYGTFAVIEELNFKGNVQYIVDNEEEYYKGEYMIIDNEGKVLLEKGSSKEDFIKYINGLESYFEAFSQDYR